MKANKNLEGKFSMAPCVHGLLVEHVQLQSSTPLIDVDDDINSTENE